MIQEDRTANTERNGLQYDPLTATRAQRCSAFAIAIPLMVVGAALLAIGAWEDDMRWLNAGFTTIGLGGMAVTVASLSYTAQLAIIQVRDDRKHTVEENHELREEMRAIRREICDEIWRATEAAFARFDAIEKGEQAICESVEGLQRGADDEFSLRRRDS